VDLEALLPYFWMLVRIIIIFAGVMTMVPILIWMERKVVAMFQFRVGPNRLGRSARCSRWPMRSSSS
jgi:NADH:ubiquinone oxidoreductase subunit H